MYALRKVFLHAHRPPLPHHLRRPQRPAVHRAAAHALRHHAERPRPLGRAERWRQPRPPGALHAAAVAERADIRNLIHLPLRHWRRYERSGTLALALSSHAIFPVDASTIEDYAYPCCRRGGECCGGGKPCCSHTRVSAYLSRAARDGAVEVFSTRTPWWYQKWGQILPTHALQLKVQRAWRNATARDAGLAMSMRFAKAPDGKGYEPVLG